jgi:hypothetical protein
MATLPILLNSMSKTRIYRILLKFRALSWAASELKVNKGTLQRYLRDERPSAGVLELKRSQLEALAARVLETNGAAVWDVDGKSVRSQISKLRRKK